ncbi:MAG: YlxR family protein [Erysipelotrichaceae bacterium]|nr:YlxR family protein [Erysipelotrichaceae bacterium]
MKKIPMRKCVATMEQLPKKELMRIVRTPEGEVTVDLTGKANGRGAYLKKDEAALEIARKKKSLEKALEVKISDEVYDSILEHIRNAR